MENYIQAAELAAYTIENWYIIWWYSIKVICMFRASCPFLASELDDAQENDIIMNYKACAKQTKNLHRVCMHQSLTRNQCTNIFNQLMRSTVHGR